MKKRLLSLALVLVLLVSLVPIGAFAESVTINITKQPESVFIRAGADASFSITATASGGTLKYAWLDTDTTKFEKLTLDSTIDLITSVMSGGGSEVGILGTESTLVLRGVTKDTNIVCLLYVVTGNAVWGWLNGANKFAFSQQVKVAIDNRPDCPSHSLSTNLRRMDAVEPTCATEGREVCYVCDTCGKYFKDPNGLTETTLAASVRPKLSNHQLLYHPAREGDCLNNSMKEYWSCTSCGKYFSDAAGKMETDLESLQLDGQRDPNRHLASNVVHYEALEANCERPGNVEYWYCNGCNKYFDDAALKNAVTDKNKLIIPQDPSVHSNVKEYAEAEADCVSYGNIHFWYCSGCNKCFSNAACNVIIPASSTQTAPLGHSYVCTPHYSGDVSDYHEQKCERCGRVDSSASHVGGIATCTNKAICSECKAPYGNLAPNNHINTELIGKVDATDRSTGYTGDLYCADCGILLEKGSAIPALCDHNVGGVSTLIHHKAVKPTCTSDGSIEYWECELCNMCSTKQNMTDWFTDASVAVLPKTGHSYLPTATKPESCTDDGIMTYTCANCGDVYTETIDATGHDYKKTVIAPTCVDTGCTRYTCTKCTDSFDSDIVPALGHDYGEWEVVTPTTCTQDGLDVRTCKRCSAFESRNNTATGHSFGAWSQVKAPTCTEKGLEYRSCQCGETETRELPSLGHSFVNEVCVRCGFSIHEHDYTAEIIAPTCTEKGYTRHTCRCGATYTDNEVKALGHSFGEWVRISDPSCSASGLEQRVCSRCNSIDSRELDKLPHNYTVEVKEPTCTEGGYTLHTCTCGYSYTDAELPSLGHDFGEWGRSVEPTCTKKGVERCDCSRCEEFRTRDVESLGHSYGAWSQMKAPTCTEKGVERCNCIRCDDYKTRDIESLGHSYGAWAQTKAPTCTEKGMEMCECSRCEDYKTREIEALGHDFGKWVQTKAPTCTEKGKEMRECSRCVEFETREIDALGHDFGKWVQTKAPTCTEKGMERCECSCCEEYDTRETAALGHDFGKWAQTKAPTCTEKGEERCDCTRCEEYDTRETAALGHDFGKWAQTKAPTCTEKGEERCDCSRCDEYKTRELAVLDHSFGEWGVEIAATCTEGGAEVRYCSGCDLFEIRDIPALDHDFGEWETEKQVTCTEDGLEIRRCSRCTETKTRVVKATDHDISEWITAFPATCTEKGTEVRYCQNCSLYEYRDIPATGHNYEPTVTEPTCTQKGYVTHVCSFCKDSFIDSETEPLDHSFVKGICVRCGEAAELSAPKASISNNASSGKCVVSWKAVSGASKYDIYRSTSKTGAYTKMYTTSNLSYTNTSAKAGTTYYYKVIAIADNGLVSPESAIVYRTCDCARPVVTGGNDASSGKCTLTWKAVDGAAKYEIYRSISKDGTYTRMYTTTKTSYTNTSSVPGISYYYKVRAISAVQSAADSAYCEPVLCACRCAKPVVSSGNSASSGKCTLTWSAVDGAEKYEVYRATSKTGSYTRMSTTTKTSYTNTSAKAGTTYYYKVKAISSVRSDFDSEFSTVVSRTCDLERPTVKISTSSGHPKLTWNKVDGASKYEIYRATSNNGTYTKMYTTSNLSYTNTSAKSGTVYYYKVIAVSPVSSYANSAYSTPVSIRAK